MTRSPDQLPSGKQFELRVAASERELDKRLAAFTVPETRHRLPGFLHLFSEKSFELDVQDRDIEGNSFTETQFRGLQMKVFNHTRNKFSFTSTVEKVQASTSPEEVRVRLQLQLGLQAAKAIMVSPFFTATEKESGVIPMYYAVPEPTGTRTMGAALEELQEYLGDSPRGVVDELMLVEHAVRHRSIRQRQREQMIFTAAPLELVDSSVEPGTFFLDYETDDNMESAS